MKVAFTGSSGAGKTTLVTYAAEAMGLTHISGSAGDVKWEGDKLFLDDILGYPGGGHIGVIKYSALNPAYAIINQKMLLTRRSQIIFENDRFITDRSPVDNIAYCINQCGYHPEFTDAMAEEFIKEAARAFEELTHLIYVKACQPTEVERNGSRVANRYYQKAIDCQFQYWLGVLNNMVMDGPKILTLDYWDLSRRKEAVLAFLSED